MVPAVRGPCSAAAACIVAAAGSDPVACLVSVQVACFAAVACSVRDYSGRSACLAVR